MNLLIPTTPTITQPASSAAPEQKPRHFFYMLHFRKHQEAFKVGISDPVELRIRQLSATYGPLDLPRCVTVAVNGRREAEVLERTVLMLHEESRHDWGSLYPTAAGGHTEWLRMNSHPEVLATVTDWVRRRAAHCRLVPIAEVAGDAVNCGGKDSVANRIRKAEKHQGALARRRAKEAARQEANRDQLRFSHHAVEQHLGCLRRVQIWVDWRRRLQARLLFRAGEPGGAPGRGFDPARLADRLAAHREIKVHRAASSAEKWTLTRSHKLIVPRSGGRYGLLVRVRIWSHALDTNFANQTPELGVWIRWLHVLRAWARKQRFMRGGADQLTLPF